MNYMERKRLTYFIRFLRNAGTGDLPLKKQREKDGGETRRESSLFVIKA